MALRIEGALARREAQARRRLDPVSERIVGMLLSDLAGADHFVGDVRDDFTDLIRLAIRFLRYRYDIEAGAARDGLAYLFGSPDGPQPGEDALAKDFHEALVMWDVAGRARYEVRGIGSGRVDVLIDHSTHEFSAEVKRELADASRGSLRRYLGQAATYSGSGVRLGMLLVLDLTPKPHGVAAFEALTWVEVFAGVSDDDLDRHIVVMKVPAARGRPSDLSRRRTAKPAQ